MLLVILQNIFMHLIELFETTLETQPFHKKMEHGCIINWKTPRNGDNYVTVWVDVAKLDASWRHDKGFYITPNGGGNSIKGRYERFGKWLEQGLPVEMPEVSINDWRDCISFGNGRHRFSWLRDHGVTSLPVYVDKDQAEEIKKRFGTSSHQSVIGNIS